MTANLETSSVTLDQASQLPEPTQSQARSRAEVRQDTRRMSTTERARLIQQKMQPSPKVAREGFTPPPQAQAQPQPAEPQPTMEEDDGADWRHSLPQVPDLEEPEAEPSVAPAEADLDSPDLEDPDGAVGIETINDFAEHLEVDPAALLELKTTVKVNGEPVEISLREALANHQHAAANTQLRQELRAQQREVEATFQERVTEVDKRFEAAELYHKAAWHVLQAEFISPEVQALKTNNPEGYVQWQDITQKRQNDLAQSYQRLMAERAEVQAAARNEMILASNKRLREDVPDVDTEERQRKILDVLIAAGVPKDEAANVFDSRILTFASKFADMQEELQKYRDAEEQAKKRVKQVKKAKGSGRPKASRPQDSSTARQVKQVMADVQRKRGRNKRLAVAEALMLQMQNRRNKRR